MAAKLWTATIKLKSGLQDVTVSADNFFKAKDLLEAQYGKANIYSGPKEAR